MNDLHPMNDDGWADVTINQFWRCPRCGMVMAYGQDSGSVVIGGPPHHTHGTERVEFEQTTEAGFNAAAAPMEGGEQ